MNKSPDISIVIGTYKTKDLIKKTIESIFNNTKKVKLELIVIDDDSRDGTYEEIKKSFPQVILKRNRKNLGYSKTYNKGTRLAKGRYVLHLNSDVLFTKGSALAKIIKYMDENNNVGISGCRVLKHDGKLDLPCRHQIPTLKNVFFQSVALYKFFPNFKKFNYYMTYLRENKITEVGGILGAFMLIRKDVFKDIGFLDENFYLYCEDTDYCYRALAKGWQVIYYPRIAVKHIHGGTTNQFRISAQIMFHKSMWYFYKKHYSMLYPFYVEYIVFFGLVIRFLLFTGLELYIYLKSVFHVLTSLSRGKEELRLANSNEV